MPKNQLTTNSNSNPSSVAELRGAAGLTPFSPTEVAMELQRLHRQADEYEQGAVAANTKANYERVWRRFAAWCERRGAEPLPAHEGVVQAYITAAASEGIPQSDGTPGEPLGRSSLEVHLSAIRYVHELQGHPNPVALLPKRFLQGLRRAKAKAPHKKRWLSQEQLHEIVKDYPTNLRGLRDKAILLVAYKSGGRRRSEVAGMQMEDLSKVGDSWLWTMIQKKVDQAGTKPLTLALKRSKYPETCPVRALEAWIQAAGVRKGPVFGAIDRYGNVTFRAEGVQPQLVAVILKKAVGNLGLDPDEFGAHSIRSGFVTSMTRAGADVRAIMERTGHRSVNTVYGYVQAAKLLDEDDAISNLLDKE